MINWILIQNSIVPLIIIGITFVILFFLKYLDEKKLITSECLRKIVHISAGILYLLSYFYNNAGYFSRYFNIFPYLLWTGILIYKSQQHSSALRQHDFIITALSRNNNKDELLRGPLFFNLIAIICGSILYETILGSIIMAILTWGDGLAAIIGSRYGNQRKIYGKKSLDGFLTCFFVGIMASIVYIHILIDVQSFFLLKICLISFVASVTETLTQSDFDNLTIPLSISLIYYLIF